MLLHGFTGGPASWDTLRARLDAKTAVFAPSLLGHGDAGELDVPSFEGEVDRLAALIAERTKAPRHLAGYSLGGRVALGLLVRHPALFASATLVGAHPGLSRAMEREERREGDARWATLLLRDGLDAFVRAWEQQPLFMTQGAVSAGARAAQRALRASHTAEGLARSLSRCGLGAMPDLTPSLPEVKLPVSLVVGGADAKFTALAQAMAARLPRARLYVLPDAGHNVLLEQPEEVGRVLRAALDALREGGR